MPEDTTPKKVETPFKPAEPKYIRDLASDIEYKTNTIIRGEMKDGVRHITYSLDGNCSRHNHPYTLASLHNITHPEIVDTLEKVLKRFESVANIKFVRVTGKDSDTADIRFYQGTYRFNNYNRRTKKFDYEPYEGGYQVNANDKTRDVVLRKGVIHPHNNTLKKFSEYGYHVGGEGYDFLLHETMHALGFSHPGANGRYGPAGGYNREYDKSGTVMSYYSPEFIGGMADLGPYDIAALQYYYGKPKTSPTSFDTKFLKHNATLYAETPASLDFRKSNEKGQLRIDLANTNFNRQIRGSLEDGHFKHINARFGVDTKITDILTSEDCQISLNLTGNTLPNRLQGSAKIDMLEAYGGGDILTGRGSADTFAFTGKSGIGNVITDFDAKDGDTIKAPFLCTRIELREHQKCAADGKNERGTQVIFYDRNNDIIADVFAINARPQDISPQLRTDQDIGISTSRVLEPEEFNPNQHLPTLPPAHGRRRIFK